MRFISPVAVDRPARVKARVAKSYPPLYLLEAELTQRGAAVATASAKFMYRGEP